MAILSRKLNTLKAELKIWNKVTFGNVHLLVENALSEVDRIQHDISIGGMSDYLFAAEQKAQLDLQKTLSYWESFWKSKAKIN